MNNCKANRLFFFAVFLCSKTTGDAHSALVLYGPDTLHLMAKLEITHTAVWSESGSHGVIYNTAGIIGSQAVHYLSFLA